MIVDDKIRDKNLKYNFNREAAKISTISSGKIDKYQYPTGEEILPFNQSQMPEQTNFTYCPLGKPFEKQPKTTEDKGIKQVESLKVSKPAEEEQ